MGNVYASPESQASKKIGSKMRREFEESENKIRLLLLGTGKRLEMREKR